MTIYCIEDDESIRELIVYALRTTGYEAVGFSDAKSLYTALQEEAPPSLILLDVMLPGEDGISVLTRIRRGAATKDIPVIMVTAKTAEFDKVKSLDSGADDYITKPFGMMELVSRVRAVLRRTSAGQRSDNEVLKVGNLVIDEERHKVMSGDEEITLTLKEYELLRELMLHIGLVLTRDQLLTRIWGYDAAVETRTVDVHVRTLRQKLGDLGNLIETVRGVGYRLATMS